MRWRISDHGHDVRQIDLLAVVALILVSIGAYFYYADYSAPPQNTAAFIVPSQHVRW